jgi:hypothetical protein
MIDQCMLVVRETTLKIETPDVDDLIIYRCKKH